MLLLVLGEVAQMCIFLNAKLKPTDEPGRFGAPRGAEDVFGFDEFKGEQEHAILSVLDGRDTFVIMPTGGGKSMCYQLPALMMDGVALVISPLIALMKTKWTPSEATTRTDAWLIS